MRLLCLNIIRNEDFLTYPTQRYAVHIECLSSVFGHFLQFCTESQEFLFTVMDEIVLLGHLNFVVNVTGFSLPSRDFFHDQVNRDCN